MQTASQLKSNEVTPSSEPIEQMISRAQSGDLQAFGALIELLGEELLRIGRRAVFSGRIDPLDIVQDSVIHAMRSIESLRNPTRAGFLSWFAGIARNRVLTLKSSANRQGSPNKKTPFPWLRMESAAQDRLDNIGDGADRVVEEEGLCPIDAPLYELSCVARVGWLMREIFGMDWGSMAVVLCKQSQAAARQSHYRALKCMDPPEELSKGPGNYQDALLVRP